MRLSLPARLILGGTVGCIAIGVLVPVGLTVTREATQIAAIEHQLTGIDLEGCEEAPEAWGWASGELSFYAYDRSGVSRNPAAPPIDRSLLARALADEGLAVDSSAERVLAVFPRGAVDGACSVLRTESRNPGGKVSARILTVLTLSVVTGMVLAFLATLLLVVRPLRKRVAAVASVARGVGRETFEPEPLTSDALGHIAEVLAQSHDRIIESQSTLEARNEALERHLAAVAHDLRTPLASMHLALEALTVEAEGSVRDEARRALADAVFLSSMVENLHQATRLRHQFDVTSGSVELTDLVRRLERRFAIVGRHAGIEVAANTPEREVWVECTPALAERAVANLLQNAIEHNDEPGHVAITLSLVAGGERFRLVVADDGPGMPEEALASLASESFLLDEARQRGPGMGTLITREVARRAGWSLDYAPLEPRGLEVQLEGPVVTIPREDDEASATEG